MPELSKEQFYILIGVILMLLIGAIYGVIGGKKIITCLPVGTAQTSPVISTTQSVVNISRNKAKIYIHVSGAVKLQGVFQLKSGDRMIDLLKMAEITQDADLDSINLAELLSDGQKIFVPCRKYANISDNSGVPQGKNQQNKVNINIADEKELDSLPGIGLTTAKRIVEHRQKIRSFSNIEQIKDVQGITKKKFESLKPLIAVN
jgi:competence protein ComEA